MKILRLKDHPVTILYNSFYYYNFYIHRPYALLVIGRAKILIEETKIPVSELETINKKDLFLIGDPNVRFSMKKYKKGSTTEDEIRNQFLKLLNEEYKDYLHIYTDGSKMDNKTSYAFITGNISEAKRLPSVCSVFTAELYAIYLAIKYINNSYWRKAVIFSNFQ